MKAAVTIEGERQDLQRICDEFQEPDKVNGSAIRYTEVELGDLMDFVKEEEIPTDEWDIEPLE